MSKTSSKTSSTRILLQRKKKWLEEEARLKPFGFCCSIDRFDPLSRYDQRKPPYESSLTAITSVHECPVSKIQVKFLTPRFSREKRRLGRIKETDQQLPKNDRSLDYLLGRNDRSVRWYLEDEIALAKDIFWTEKQRVYNETSDKAIAIGKKKHKSNIKSLLNAECPRWYQDFSPKQMKNLMNLENIIRTDYEERITSGTQTTLMAIGVISTFFKLKPNVIRELHNTCNLNSVNFLREIYKILTGIDFQEEGHKKFYDCNERIILSGIAFLTLPETVEELHRRLPAVIMPKLPPKPKPPVCLARRKNTCPYKEDLFRRPDWVTYRNDLQEWRKRRKLFEIPRVILPAKKYSQSFINDEILSDVDKKQEQDIYAKDLENSKELQKISADKFDQEEEINVYANKHQQIRYVNNIRSEENCGAKKLESSDIPRPLEENRKLDFMITGLGEKPGPVEYKICGMLKPSGAKQKSWLGKKDAHYIIAGVSEDPPSCPVTYEISGVAEVTPSNSDERFFAVLKLGDGPRKIFPSGRENLSRNWQEWLREADEEFRRVEKQTNELIKSVRATTRLVFPEPVCDSCCSCRQTRMTREKLRRSKAPYLLIDNVLQDKDEKKYIVGSIVMHSPAPSPTGSAVNLLNMIASQEEIETNIIINGVTKENGRTQYYISGVQKEKIHIPRQIPDFPAPEPVRNIPPCACAIQQMFNKNVSPSASKDDIPWTKNEGLCMGKKYRPDGPAAYSCKMYPGDKSCRRNPFMKDIMKIRKEKEEKDEKEKIETIKVTEEQIQDTKRKITEKKSDKFIPDPDYPAYDDPWNILRTAPSGTSETDYEKSLKLTSPVFPAISSPATIQKKTKHIFSSIKEPKKVIKNSAIKKIDEKVSGKISLKSSRKIQKGKSEEMTKKEHPKKKKNARVFSTKIITGEKDEKLSSKICKSMTMKVKKYQAKSPLTRSLAKQQFNKIDKIRARNFAKKDKRKDIIDEVEQLDNRKREMARLKNMLRFLAPGVQPAILPDEQRIAAVEKPEEAGDSVPVEEKSKTAKKDPCGWRTKSEQELPAKKTLGYLCEPDYPLETIAVRPGGRPCRCRENRSKKKILMYNVAGLVDRRKRIGKSRKTKLEKENRIIDGVVYFTPPVSPRRSDEYIPEYDLLESPYDMCVGETKDKRLKLIERYSGPKSIVEKVRKKPKSCSCSNYVDRIGETKEDADQKKSVDEARRKLMESKSPEERWAMALKDAALMDYFTQPRDNAPCWTSCEKYHRSVRTPRLKVKKPVCECKYERKIVERNEEKMKWKTRQRRLKALKKQPFMHIDNISRPMVPDTKFIISDVKRIPREDEKAEDIKYCITGVAENLSMSPPQKIIEGLKMSSPFETPEPSKEDISQIAPHRHWSPMNILPGPLPTKNTTLKEEMERKKKVRDEAFRLIYGDQIEQDTSCSGRHGCQKTQEQEVRVKKIEKNLGVKKSSTNVEKKILETLDSPSLKIKKTSDKVDRQPDIPKETVHEVVHKKKKHPEEYLDKIDQQYKHVFEEIEKNDNERHQENGDSDIKHAASKMNLVAIVKTELKKMSMEGYVFAELPKCYLMPQLQNWIKYRQGVVFSEADKKKLMRMTTDNWRLMKIVPMPKIKLLSLCMTKYQLKKLTYDRAEEMKEKIKQKKAFFHSKIRKSRVSYANSMWRTMEFGKFPSISFKRAFFTYMASKEADGHVFKPWLRSEVRKRDLEFSCYW